MMRLLRILIHPIRHFKTQRDVKRRLPKYTEWHIH